MALADDILVFQQNVQQFPALVDALAGMLGVSAEALTAIGVGWHPAENAWVFPERDSEGKVVGLVYRYPTGKKRCLAGSHRGLTFEVNPSVTPAGANYTPGAHNWVRCSKALPCPLCGRTSWCMVSAENPADPRAVLCGKTAEGAKSFLGGEAGYLHILKPEGDFKSSDTLLPQSQYPVLVVEGQSDTAAALTLGFQAVGKPSASGGLPMLRTLLAGRHVVVIGENDSGAGQEGMEKTFEALKKSAASLVKLMPPAGVKDLRAWVRWGLNAETLLAEIQARGDAASSERMLDSVAPLDLANLWLQKCHWGEGYPILRKYAGDWYRFDGSKYLRVEDVYVRGSIYEFFADKLVKKASKSEIEVVPFDLSVTKVNNILDACSVACPVYTDPPCWLTDGTGKPEPIDMIRFANGILTLPERKLIPNTPAWFAMTAIPYDWDPDAQCPAWMRFIWQVFAGDLEQISLLQEWFGLMLVPDTRYEKMMFFIGRPGAGKGTAIEAMRAMLGSAQVVSTQFDNISSHFGLHSLVGKLAAIMPDAHITRRADPGRVLEVLKMISGRDGVEVNRKFRESLADYRMACRFTISVNSLPELPDHERSLDRRLLLLHFGQCFTGREDPTLKDRLIEEAPGIARWALAGLLRVRSRGEFTVPEASKPFLRDFQRQSSPVSEFLDEYGEFAPNYQIPTAVMYDAYAYWCRDQGIQAGSMSRFIQRVQILYPGTETDRMTFDGKQVRCLTGVMLSQAGIDRYLEK